LGWIDREGRKQSEESEALTRIRLAKTEQKALDWKPDSWIDACVYEFLRHKTPAMIRLLLEPRYLDHRLQAVRLLAIQALGRLGDVRTVGPEGKDAVEALAIRLRDIDLDLDPAIGEALTDSLALLGDSRVYEILSSRLSREPESSEFRRLVQSKWREISLPVDFDRTPALAPRTASEFISRGLLFEAAQDWFRAMNDYDRAIEIDSRCADAHVRKGRLLEALKKSDDALTEFSKTLEIDPRNVDASLARGRLHFAARRLREALRDAEHLISVVPASAEGWLLRGEIRYGEGDLTGAASDFEKAADVDPRKSHGRGGRAHPRCGVDSGQDGAPGRHGLAA